MNADKKLELKKWWVTWTVRGKKKGIDILAYSKKEAEASILAKHKPKAIPFEDKYKTN